MIALNNVGITSPNDTAKIDISASRRIVILNFNSDVEDDSIISDSTPTISDVSTLGDTVTATRPLIKIDYRC